ncbi:3-isopropylmalate dehydrogenase [Butyrivibrio sp. AE2032]|uniref:3-isopropylmalate dehydrogenase n=1 Tax=Butyrivibrio sp. AE2032 TaxID=1458463 RepID=UPI0005519697|nr:3-isopropylmalate dehydrogenase [Butyrivibrio sp. AE2032]
MPKKYNIAVIPGDGIGPEITSAAIEVLEAAVAKKEIEIFTKELKAGGAAIDLYGIPLPQETIAAAKDSDAVLLGAVGGPKWDDMEPEVRPERALLGLRSGLGLYANIRPVKVYDQLKDASPLKNPGNIDFIIVRELTGGIYFGKNGVYQSGDRLPDGTVKGKIAFDTESYSEGEINRILKIAFELAMKRRRKVTLVDKANVLTTSRMWRTLASQMSFDFPEVELECLYIDNAAMQLISRPSSFDVIVTSNLFGDILSDEAGQIAGSIGMLPSASIGTPGTPGLFEPIHGSAPDIAGQNKANPLGAILSAAMMMRIMFNEEEIASDIEEAVRKTLESGLRTSDITFIGENNNVTLVGTTEITKAVIENL